MNKKIIGIIIAVVLVIAIIVGIVIATKGGNKEGSQKNKNLEEVTISTKVDYNDETISATIGYPKDAGISVEDDLGEYSKIFKSEEKNWELNVSIQADTTYDDNKDYNSEEEGYQEVTFNGFKGYIYNDSESRISGAILLGDGAEDNVYKYLDITITPIDIYVDDEEVEVYPLYESKEVQTILNSIEFSGFKGEISDSSDSEDSEEAKTKNYGEFKDRTDGISDKEGLIFIPSYTSPDEDSFKAEQRNDNVGIDNDLWYKSDESAYDASSISVRIFPKSGTYGSMEEYIEEKGDMYHWSKQTVAGKEYDTFTFGSGSSTPEKFSKYYQGAFMVGNRVVEFSYSMYKEIPNQDLGDTFFNQILDSIEYSEDFK